MASNNNNNVSFSNIDLNTVANQAGGGNVSMGQQLMNEQEDEMEERQEEQDFSQDDIQSLSQQVSQDGQINLPEQEDNLIDLPDTGQQQTQQPNLGPQITRQDIQSRPENNLSTTRQLTSTVPDTTEDVSNTAKLLADSIQQVESGGDPTAQGASGESGAFQFMPGTWEQVSQEVAGQTLEQTPENEQMVAEAKIDQLLQEGRSPEEVALIWNTSLGGEEEPLRISGVNEQGVEFDSEAYSQKVLEVFESRSQSVQQQPSQEFDIESLTQDQSPSFTENLQGVGEFISEGAVDVGEGALALGEGLGRAALSPFETGEDLVEGFHQGLPRTQAALQEAGAQLIDITTDTATTIMEAPWKGLEKLVGEENYEAPDFNKDLADAGEEYLQNLAEKNRQQAQRMVEEGGQIEGTFIEKLSNPEYLARDLIGRNAPSLAASAASALAGGLPAAIVTGGAIEGGAAVSEAREFARQTGNEELANDEAFLNKIMGGVGIAAGILEATGIEAVLSRSPIGESLKRKMYGRIGREMATGALGEGATEPLQEIVANVAAQTYDENRDLFEGTAEAFVAGGLLGGGGSLVSQSGAEWVAQGMPMGMSIQDVSDQQFNVPEGDRNRDVGEIINRLEQNSQQVSGDDLQILNQTYEGLKQQVENNPARDLSRFERSDGSLSENAEQAVEESDTFDSMAEARSAYRSYRRQRNQFQAVENAVKSGQFSVRQVMQKVRQEASRTESEAQQQERQNIRQQLRQQQDEITDISSEIRNYAKEFLPKSERGRAMTLIENAIKARKPETRQQRLGTAFARINEIADQTRKKQLRSEIENLVNRYADSQQIAPRFRQRIQDAVSDFDLTGLTESKRQELESTLDFVQESGAGSVPSYVLKEISRLDKQRWEDLSPDQLENTLDELNRLIQLGRTKRQTQESIYESQKQQRKEDILAQEQVMETIKPDNNVGGIEPTGTLESLQNTVSNAYKKTRAAIQRFDKAVLPVSAIFRLIGGAHQKVKQTIDERTNVYNQRLRDILEEINNYIKENELTQKDLREVAVVAYRNQEGGVVRLKNGNGLTEEEINSVELTDEQQGLLDLSMEKFDQTFPEMERVARELENVSVEQVRNYIPFLFDPDSYFNNNGTMQTRRDLPDMNPNATQDPEFPTKRTEEGRTKERLSEQEIENMGEDYPALDLNFGRVVSRGLSDVLYYTEMARDVRQYFEIFNSDEYAQQHGEFMQEEMTDWLSVVATQGGYRNKTRIRALDQFKNNTTAATLAFKASTALIQSTALVDAMLEVNPRNLAKGLFHMTSNSNAREFVNKMPEIEDRVAGESALQDLKNTNKGKNKIINFGFKGITSIDTFIAKATALGAYFDYAEQNGIELDINGDPDQDGIVYSQQKVEATMSNNEEKDKPLALSAGNLTGNKSIDNTLLQFQSFMMRRWAQFRVDAVANGLLGDTPADKMDGARRIALMATALTIESGIMLGLDDLLEGDDEEDQEFFGEMAKNTFQFVPLGGNAMSTVMYNSSPVPAMSFFNQSVRNLSGAFTAAESDTRKRNAIKGLMQGIGGATGLPGTIAQSRRVGDTLVPENDLPSSQGGGEFDMGGGFGGDTDFGGDTSF